MTAATACRTCGTKPLDNASFCHGCGSPLTESSTHAEYKQVTVLFADVVHSMAIAAAVGAERLREIMADLADQCAAVVQRYGGTVNKFTGDGIMAAFGAPMALEDHATRACMAEAPVVTHRLLDMGEKHRAVGRVESILVGRQWEMAAAEGLLQRAVAGHGAVVGVVGLPGIGKSPLVREVSAMAAARGVDVFTTFCESHTSQVPFHAVARLLRAATGVEGLDGQEARDRVRDRIAEADPEDLLLFDDLLSIAEPDAPLPAIDPDARRRRLTALVNAASWPAKPRRSLSLRTPIGSMSSASRCWPISSP